MIEIEDVIKRLDLEEKVSLLAGQDFWSLPAIERIGLRSLVMSDGPIGVRGTGWAPDDPSIALPSPTALAAAWDRELAETAGRLLGQEARRKGVHVVLGPTVNLQRTPLGGRHFECYSEDPLLSGEIAVGFVRGVQEHGVGTTVKHLVGNDFETDRMEVDVRIDERTLREIYLAPFERVVEAGGAGRIVLGERDHVGMMFLGDHQDVHPGLRVDVAEGERGVGLVHDRGRDLAGDDAAEQAVVVHPHDLRVGV